MKQEIERKFLVKVERLPPEATRGGQRLVQGYLASGPTVRVRLVEGEGLEDGWLTIKGPGKVSRAEYEYRIPAGDARELLELSKARLSKIRRLVRIGAHTWEVDEFLGPLEGLWMAEIELEAVDEPFDQPAWLDREVSEDPRYSNASLARAGRSPEP